MINHTFLKRLIAWSLCLLLTPAWGAERTTYYHLDLLGSPAAASDSTGQVVWREEYKPYGERTLGQDQNTNALWYTGKVHEEALGLSYYGARWYDPELGRFTGIDPVEVDENNLYSFNRYAYANNNPYKYVDPDGRVPVDTLWDAANVVYDLGKAGVGYATGNTAMVAEGLSDAALDVGAMLVPYVPAGSSKLARKAAREAKKKADLPGLDSTGKVHGELPSPKNLKKYSNEELGQLQSELKQSVQRRIKKTVELGSDKGHGQRQAAEQQLIKSIDKKLNN